MDAEKRDCNWNRRTLLKGIGLSTFSLASFSTDTWLFPEAWAAPQPTRFVYAWTAFDLLDPHVKYDGNAYFFNLNMYDNLLRYQGNPPEIVPWLAETYHVTDDGRRWTFHLRRGMQFHDGSELTAEAVRFTFERLLAVRKAPSGVFKRMGLTNDKVRFQGQDMLAMPEADLTTHVRGKAITVIPQDPLPSLNPLFPIGVQLRDLLKWSRRHGTLARARATQTQLLNLLTAVQLPSPETQLRKYPHEFSGGQRQRLLIAAALAPDPALIIADELTSALDVTVQAQILLLLKALVKERGTSVFLITHDLGVVAKLCDRVAVMYAGQEAEIAPTESLFTHPSHPYTQKLLDSLPERQQGEIQGIPGVVPSLIDPPQGCRFHTRCGFVMPVCRQERPPAVELFPDHWVRCHLSPGVPTQSELCAPRV